MPCKARNNGPRSVSARAATRLYFGRRALLRSQGEHAPWQHLRWIFRAGRAGPPQWASGRSEGARRRAGAHPQLRQQSREAAWREGEQRRPEASTRGLHACGRAAFRVRSWFCSRRKFGFRPGYLQLQKISCAGVKDLRLSDFVRRSHYVLSARTICPFVNPFMKH